MPDGTLSEPRSAELGAACAAYLRAAPVEPALAWIDALSGIDRFQASEGIALAADCVLGWAADAGLEQLTIERHPADGAARWWSFAAPRAWTPRRARAEVFAADGSRGLLVDHREQPFSLATYSAATPPGGRDYALVEGPGAPGAVLMVPRDGDRWTPEQIAATGAAGYVTDLPTRCGAAGEAHSGRIELAPGATIFGFSVTPEQMARLRAAAAAGARLRIEIDIDETATMPLASGLLPGAPGPEFWVVSHLCHPRPGANDNASGVAASLALAQMLARLDAPLRPRQTIRFIWGPEFLGTVAALHRWPAPAFVLNLDMVGENQALCESPFVIERSPNEIGAAANAVAEACVAEVFRQTQRGGDCWRATPFVGFSDHCLFADATLRVPAVQFCHPDDRFNHSGADTPDKVCPLELRRTIAAAAATLLLVGEPAKPSIRSLLGDWLERESREVDRVAAASPSDWGKSFRTYWRDQADNLSGHAVPINAAPAAERVPRRCWDGPINVRGMLGALPAATRAAVLELIARDKRVLSLLFATGMRIDGRRSRDSIDAAVSFEARRPIDPALHDQIWRCFEESGWIELTRPAG